jgi:hypothetical protein
MFVYNTVTDYVSSFKQGKIRDTIVEIPRFRLMQFFGTYRGFSRERPVSDRLWRRFYYPDTNEYRPESGPTDNTIDSDTEIKYPEEIE